MKIKGFDKDLKCRGFQFEIGKEYKIKDKGELKLCSDSVFHYCDTLQKVHQYYHVLDDNRYCEIEVLGKEITDGNKFGSNHIKIIREIVGEELNILKGLTNGNSGIFNSGDWNSGDFNSCNYSNGVFCNTDDDNIRIFNNPSGMSFNEFRNSKYYTALCSSPFILTEWVGYTNDEKKESERKALDEGYLKEYSYKDACKNWWDNMSDENKEIVLSIPNFDKEVFEDITGIKI